MGQRDRIVCRVRVVTGRHRHRLRRAPVCRRESQARRGRGHDRSRVPGDRYRNIRRRRGIENHRVSVPGRVFLRHRQRCLRDRDPVRGFGGAVDVGGDGRKRNLLEVAGRDAVVPRGAGGEAGVGVGGGSAVGVDDVVGPGGAAIGGDLDPVAGNGPAAVVGRGVPGQVDPAGAAGGGGQAGRGGGGVYDAGDAAGAGGEGSDVVAGCVLDGVGVVAAGGVGVGEDDALARAEHGRNRKIQSRQKTGERNDAGAREGSAVGSAREGRSSGQVGLIQGLGEPDNESSGRDN